MAPEMLQKKGHDYAVDYYCLGAILYELVVGSPPFYTTHTTEMFERILSEDISFPEELDLSDEIIDLISNLLIKEPKYRRGSMGGVKEILAHPWCKKTNIKDIEARIIETPIKPNVFDFYVDEVSDDGDITKKMKDIYDEAFDELSLEDENEKVFKNFYYEAQQKNTNFEYSIPKSPTQKHCLSIPDFTALKNNEIKHKHTESEEKYSDAIIKQLKKENSHSTKQNFSSNNNGPYFIAEQYRAKKSHDFSNVYSNYLKQQKSADFKISTSNMKVNFYYIF